MFEEFFKKIISYLFGKIIEVHVFFLMYNNKQKRTFQLAISHLINGMALYIRKIY